MPTYWINGKRHVSDKDLTPDELEALSGPQLRPTPQKNLLQQGWEAISSPLTTIPSQIGSHFADMIPESTDPGFQAANEMLPGLGTGLSSIAGFAKGAFQGAGDVATQMTSPIDLLALGSGLGEASAIKTALGGARSAEQAAAAARTASRLGTVRQAASAPVVAHGAINLLHGESTPMERLMAVPELAGGMAGVAAPKFSGNATYQPPPPDFGLSDMGSSTRRLPDADFLGPQDINPPAPPVRPPMRELPPAFMEGEVIAPDIPFTAERQAAMQPWPEDMPQVLPPEGNNLPFQPPKNVTPEPGLMGQNWPAEIAPTEFPVMPQGRRGRMSPMVPDEAVAQAVGGNMGGQVFDQAIPPGMLEQRVNQAMQQAKPEVLTPEIMPNNPMNFEVVGTDITGSVSPEDLARVPGPTSKKITTPSDLELPPSFERHGPTWIQQEDGTIQRFDGLENQIKEGLGPEPDPLSPQLARTQGGGIKIGADVRRAAGELTTGYSGDLTGIMVREGMQNALDAIKSSGQPGRLNVQTYDDGFEITDSGRGMTRNELETVFSDLHSSGKATEEGATGGKGVGKASYMLGGEHFRVETVTTEKGKRVRYVMEGTPEQLLTEVFPQREEVSSDTPTGTKIATKFKTDQPAYGTRGMLSNILKYSRGITPELSGQIYGTREEYIKDQERAKRTGVPRKPYSLEWADRANDRVVASENLGEAKATLIMSKSPDLAPRTGISVRVLNNGMFQYNKWLNLDEEVGGVPDEIIVNIEPSVDEGTTEYPFPVQRENMKDTFDEKVNKLIKDKIINPLANQRKSKLAQIYDNLSQVNPKGLRKNILFDPGDRLTPAEKKMMLNSPLMQELNTLMDLFVDQVLEKVGNKAYIDKLEGIGFVLDPSMHGVHIPNPTAPKNNPKSIILLNPFEYGKKPMGQIAEELTTTLLHELAHIGHEVPESFRNIDPNEVTSPRAGRFLETYLREVQSHSGGDMGHGISFVKRMGEIYAKAGIENSVAFTDAVEQAIGDEGTGQYSSEFQELLSIYSESRGREPITEDFLSGTGVKQRTPAGGRGGSQSNGPNNAGGTPSASDMIKAHPVRELWNLPRGLMSVDAPFVTSAALRQGLPWVASKHWWAAWVKQAKAFGSERAYKDQIAKWETDNLYRPQVRFRGQGNAPIFEPSIAEQMGLATSDLTDMTRREEVLKGQLAEKIPMYGKWVRGSNRAYTAFLNHIRYSAFKDLVEDMGAWNGRNITNVPLAKEIANFVNTTTGRGSGKLTLGVSNDKSATINLERVMGPLGEVFFSPRLWKSRLDMMNPSTYIMASPQMRKQWIKAWLATAGAWWGIASLLEMAGATVSKDPNNSDYGKARIGNTRIDPGGGFQQNLVMANRVLNPMGRGSFTMDETGFTPIDLATGPMRYGGGGITSPVSGKFQPYGQEFRGETRMSDMVRFTANKLHPSAKYIYDYFNRNKRQPFYLGDRTAQLFLPMFAGDVAETVMEDPGLAALSFGASSVGMGAQTFEGGPGKPTFTPLTGLENYDPTFK